MTLIDLDARIASQIGAVMDTLSEAQTEGILSGEWPQRYALLRSYLTSAGPAFGPAETPLVDTLCAWVDKERDRRTALDFAWDFGDTLAVDDLGTAIGAGIRRLQMRKDDLRNWQVAQGAALTAIVSGSPSAVIPIRAEDNWNIQTTAVQVLGVLAAVTERGVGLLMYGGALKTAVRAAQDPLAVDLVNGWPFDPVTPPQPPEAVSEP